MNTHLRTTIISSTLLFIYLTTYSQTQVEVDNTDSNWIRYSRITSESKRIYDHERYQGDVYLYDEWKKAEFTLPDDSKLPIDSLKLNLLRGHVEIYLKGKHLELRGSQFNSFTILDNENSGAEYKSKHFYFDKGTRLPGIIKSIDLGDHNVLVAYKPEVRRVSQENPLMIEKLKKDRVRVTKLRYIEYGGELSRIKNKKDLQKFFGSKKGIKDFISKNKINHREEGDIVKLIQFAYSNG